MKYIRPFCLTLIYAILFSATTASVAAESGYYRGDADSDNAVTILDATVIQRKLVDLPVASFNEKAADVDGDGLNITDATKIQRYLANFSDSYQIGEFVRDNTTPSQDEYELPFIPN